MVNRRGFLTGLVAGPLLSSLARGDEAKPWTYEGSEGPEKWGELDPANQACAAGLEQSPVDLRGAYVSAIESIRFDWKTQPFPIVNTGRSVYANVAKGSTMTFGNEEFALRQIVFHMPSEHLIDGVRYAMEIQFVHALGGKRMATVAVLVKVGARNEAFSAMMGAAPGKMGTQPVKLPVDPNALLPKTRSVFRYRGSVTVPPCTEIVDWIVFSEPLMASQSDIDVFKLIFANNARPVQPVNRRIVLRGVI